MPASPPRRRPLPSWSVRCRGAGALVVVCLMPALTQPGARAQDTVPVPARIHHPRHPHHGRAGHHHPAPRGAAHPGAAPPKAPAVLPAPIPTPIPAPAPAPTPPAAANKGSNTGLPLPRFAALRADEVNMRSGPGTRYPILWLYKRRDLPVEIEREFDVWRLVEDADGVKGWVHQATLVGSRSFVVIASSPPGPEAGAAEHAAGTKLRDDPRDDAGILAILRPGVIGRLRECPAGSDWCRVSTHNYSGWLQRSAIFGLLPNEAITPP